LVLFQLEDGIHIVSYILGAQHRDFEEKDVLMNAIYCDENGTIRVLDDQGMAIRYQFVWQPEIITMGDALTMRKNEIEGIIDIISKMIFDDKNYRLPLQQARELIESLPLEDVTRLINSATKSTT